MTKSFSFIGAQAEAMRFWAKNQDNDLVTRVTFLVSDQRGQRNVSFARDVDDYVVESV